MKKRCVIIEHEDLKRLEERESYTSRFAIKEVSDSDK